MLPRIKTYTEFVCLYLNTEWERAYTTTTTADAVMVGTGKATVPNAWIDILTDDPEEQARWRINEFRKEL